MSRRRLGQPGIRQIFKRKCRFSQADTQTPRTRQAETRNKKQEATKQTKRIDLQNLRTHKKSHLALFQIRALNRPGAPQRHPSNSARCVALLGVDIRCFAARATRLASCRPIEVPEISFLGGSGRFPSSSRDGLFFFPFHHF